MGTAGDATLRPEALTADSLRSANGTEVVREDVFFPWRCALRHLGVRVQVAATSCEAQKQTREYGERERKPV